MDSFIAFVAAMAVCLATVPVLARLAPRLGMLDLPGGRKVHANPVPRVGGIGIALGTTIAVALLAPGQTLMHAYMAGGAVLIAFGVWDDSHTLGPYVKMAGQALASLPLVAYAGVYVSNFPLLSDPLSPAMAVPFTVFAVVGAINAVNTSDGLDGLAGGETLVTLGGVAYLAGPGSGGDALVIAAATAGGILGFLRFNNHPARVFMGDSGSQFLGYTSGLLVLVLTQRIDPAMSPGAVLLLLGVPIADLLFAMSHRLLSGKHPMHPDKQHVHHRLLRLGFTQHQTVGIIYLVQLLSVLAGVLLGHSGDVATLGTYAVGCAVLFGALQLAERTRWRLATGGKAQRRNSSRAGFQVLAPRVILEWLVPLYLVSGALAVGNVPIHLALPAAGLALLIGLDLTLSRSPRSVVRRALLFLTIGTVAYAQVYWLERPLLGAYAEPLLLSGIAAVFAAAVLLSPRRRRLEFIPGALDYLLIGAAVLAPLYVATQVYSSEARFVAHLLVLFYAGELVLSERRRRIDGMGAGMLLATATLAVNGFG